MTITSSWFPARREHVERSPRTLLAPLAWTAYLLIPVAGWGLFEGCPLDPLGVAALSAVWWIWATRETTLGWSRPLIALTVVKLLLGGPLLVERGFLARYFANPSWTAPHERSLDFPRSPATRIDRRLDFGPEAASDLPLPFHNELRFNFYEPAQPAREKLPFSVEWSGYVETHQAEQSTFYLTGDALASELIVDGQRVVVLGPDQRRRTGSAPTQPGWHQLTVRLSGAQGAGRRFEAGRIDPEGRDRPLDASTILVRRASRSRIAFDRIMRSVSVLADVLLALALAWWGALSLVRCLRATASPGRGLFPRSVTALIWLAASFDAFLFALPASGRLVLLGGGGDPLTYESLARDIALHGPLMLLGAARGQAAPFYYQPLYPYALALFHIVFGEGFFGIYFLQRLLIVATAFSMASTASMLMDRRTGRLVFVLGGVFLVLKAGPWAGVLLGEGLFIPLVAVWVQLLVTTAVKGPSLGFVTLAGFVGGLATLSRSTLLLAWVVALPAWGLALRLRQKQPVRWLVLLLVVTVGVTSTAALRNWVAAHRFVPLSTSFSVNLFLGNEPPKSLDVTATPLAPFYESLHLDQYTRSVIEFARQAPGPFARHLGQKAVYTLGLFRWSGLTPSATGSVPYVVVWALAAVGLAIAWRRSTGGPASLSTLLLPGLVSGTHFFSVVGMFPNIYGDRLILPLYVLLLPYAGYAMVTLTPDRVRIGDEWVHVLLAAALLGSAVFVVDGEALVFGLGAILLVVASISEGRPIPERRHLPYLAYLAVVTTSALVHRSTEGSAEYWRQILFLAIAFSSARLFRSRFAQNIVTALLVATIGGWLLAGGGWSFGSFSPVLSGSGAAASQLWRWHGVGDAIGAGRVWFGKGLSALAATNDAGIDAGSASGFVAVVAALGLVGLLCYLVMWIRVLAISFDGALAGQPRAATIHGVLLASFLFNQRLSAATPQASLAFLMFTGIAFGLVEAPQRPPMRPIGTAGPRSSPMATPT